MKYRHEQKYLIDLKTVNELRAKLNKVMAYDSHANENGVYTVKSLYFDNCYDKILSEKHDGVNYREKYRIRYYNNDYSFIRLEKKSKINGLCSKQSETVSKEFCDSIIERQPFYIFDGESDFLREFNIKRRVTDLKPKSIVMYEREAFLYSYGNVRITLDTHIRGSDNVYNFFNTEFDTIPILPTAILEIKWDDFLPQFVRDIVQIKNKSISSFSKYAAIRFI